MQSQKFSVMFHVPTSNNFYIVEVIAYNKESAKNVGRITVEQHEKSQEVNWVFTNLGAVNLYSDYVNPLHAVATDVIDDLSQAIKFFCKKPAPFSLCKDSLLRLPEFNTLLFWIRDNRLKAYENVNSSKILEAAQILADDIFEQRINTQMVSVRR